MDKSCLQHCLTDDERATFDRDGYLIIEDALPQPLIKTLVDVVDRLDREHRPKQRKEANDVLLLADFIGKDPVFLELLDLPRTIAKVWGILGWNMHLYHSHLNVTPPTGEEPEAPRKRLAWHQDSDRINRDMELELPRELRHAHTRPRLSLKVGYFLTDTRSAGCGNFWVIPGTHLSNRIEFPKDGVSDPPGGVEVRVKPGTAVMFDRRLWHSPSPNRATWTRKALFYGYSYRWIRPRDNMTVDHLMADADPIRRQLLGAATGGRGYTSPEPADVPLREWLREHLGDPAVVR